MELDILIQNFIEQYGIISIFIIVMLEYANLPLPSEIVLPFAGIMVVKSNMNFFIVLIVSILAGVVGSITNYIIGAKFGNPLIKYLLKKYPKTKKSVEASIWWMNKYGKISVMISRVVPIARTFIYIPAGINKMNILSFTFYSTIGIGIWNTILITLGYLLGDNLSKIEHIMKNYSLVVAVLILIIFFIVILKMKRKRVLK